MTKKTIQIVSFDVPYPPNYGGVIDVYYKIKALSELGVKVYLHCYQDKRAKSDVLESLCEEVYYYDRTKTLKHFFSSTPFIVSSRNSKTLAQNLKSINAPMLFEGLHTTAVLLKHSFKDQLKLVRMHNIEHHYYQGLFKSESNLLKKLFFWFESKKLKRYEVLLQQIDSVLTISPNEQDYYKLLVNNAHYSPVFHRNIEIKTYAENGKYVLFHGDLRVSDNIKSAKYLIDVFKQLPKYNLVLASSFANKKISNSLLSVSNMSFVKIEDSNHLDDVFRDAQLHVILSYQNTGIKLKLINALYQGRHVIANTIVTDGTGLKDICEVFDTKQDLILKVKALYSKEFTKKDVLKRSTVLQQFDTKINALKILELL
ncbi:glycosyltransferase [Ichthyenterobacterium sp. W332]|uniref:Glycosyltransferase n=1 Tax=Microcosmobacter mediterraneus TaxID=3075607 RepID=A0ABU2YM54_9FLAO|nr:glycosyltransferase [Ichthyenterobacterium sp. W332]MDT0559238.1 glycosyltransferase [Ichthyenterobacterium sp. W332]